MSDTDCCWCKEGCAVAYLVLLSAEKMCEEFLFSIRCRLDWLCSMLAGLLKVALNWDTLIESRADLHVK